MTGDYLPILTELDRWQADAGRRHPGVVPCRSGCTACCHGPFDISIADVALLREGIARLEPAARAEVQRTATAQVAAMRAAEPGWDEPYEVAAIGEDRFDALTERFADLPCPLLDPTGACRVYRHRPMICRLMGLGLVSEHGDVIENDCPIQDQFPRYRALPPQPFALEAWERREADAKRAAAAALLGDPERAGFETTIPHAVLVWTK